MQVKEPTELTTIDLWKEFNISFVDYVDLNKKI